MSNAASTASVGKLSVLARWMSKTFKDGQPAKGSKEMLAMSCLSSRADFHNTGARDYLLKDVGQEELVRAARAVNRGEAIFSPAIAERLIHYFAALRPAAADLAFPELTDREREILHLIAQGHSNSEIAECLLLRTKMVQNHVSNIFSKLQVADPDAGLGLERDT